MDDWMNRCSSTLFHFLVIDQSDMVMWRQEVRVKAPEFQGLPFPSGWDAVYPPGGQPRGEEGAYEHRAHQVQPTICFFLLKVRAGRNGLAGC